MTITRFLTTVAIVATFGVPAAAGQRNSKLDDSLRESVARGCSGTKSVIIRTKPGARAALRKSLQAQGRRVKGEFPALDAMTIEVRCADLNALAKFADIASVSDNAKVHGHQLETISQEPTMPIVEEPTMVISEEPPALVTEETIDEGMLSAYSSGFSSTTMFSSS